MNKKLHEVESHITIEYDCGCKWYEMNTNEYFPLELCSDHKLQAFQKAFKAFCKGNSN